VLIPDRGQQTSLQQWLVSRAIIPRQSCPITHPVRDLLPKMSASPPNNAAIRYHEVRIHEEAENALQMTYNAYRTQQWVIATKMAMIDMHVQ
jgi:hypothetical protein